MPKKKYKYNFGDKVLVSEAVFFTYEHGDKKILRIADKKFINKLGVVVGGKFRRVGRVERVVERGEYGEIECSYAYLADAKTVFVYEVRFGFLNKIVEALEEDLYSMTAPDYKLPLFECPQLPFDEDYKQMLREDMKSWPRDSKGRWTK